MRGLSKYITLLFFCSIALILKFNNVSANFYSGGTENDNTPQVLNNILFDSLFVCGDVVVSHAAGYYPSPRQITLSTSVPQEIIYYTLDGSEPDQNSPAYQSPIIADSVTVLRARTFREGWLPGKITTRTYFIDRHFDLPVISLVTDPENLWSDSAGIYILGPNADTTDYPYWGANFWQDWERRAHIEFFDSTKELGFNLDCGIKIFGSWSRIYPQKSLAVYTRGGSGPSKIDYRIFPELEISEFNNIVLRNAGQDWGRTFFRDAMIHSFANGTSVDAQAYRPAFAFFNGRFMGIFNLREKINEHYIEAHHNTDKANIDMIERDTTLLSGDIQSYNQLIQFLSTNSLSDQANYEYTGSLIDIDNFIDYILIRFFSATSDWPWNNVKIWRTNDPPGKWKWILFDTDYGFNGGHLNYTANMFDELRYQNSTHTSFIFFKLADNAQFRRLFINRYADLLNTKFSKEKLLERINYFRERLMTSMPLHIERWKFTFNEVWWLGKSIDSMDEWIQNIQIAKDFASQRTFYERYNLAAEFGLIETGMGTVNVTGVEGAGRIKINSLTLSEYPFSGQYFITVPVKLYALPDPGYKFVSWTGIENPDQSTEIEIVDGMCIGAVFTTDTASSNSLVINEINYNSSPDFDSGDWVEFLNNSDSAVSLEGWQFKDENDNHIFTFGTGSFLPPGGYTVLCEDTAKFRSVFPEVMNFIGETGFGFSGGGELLRLFDPSGVLTDSVFYDDNHPWPAQPDGGGATLSLINPNLDNSLPQNWGASGGHGTPGFANDNLSSAENDNMTPAGFRLFQNFPNPFNPATTVRFAVPSLSFISVSVFDILGREIARLAEGWRNEGVYEVVFDANDRAANGASGVYFCVMTCNENGKLSRSVIKMLLLK